MPPKGFTYKSLFSPRIDSNSRAAAGIDAAHPLTREALDFLVKIAAPGGDLASAAKVLTVSTLNTLNRIRILEDELARLNSELILQELKNNPDG